MENQNMKLVHIGEGKDTLTAVPKPPTYLNSVARKHFSAMGQMLASKDRLKNIYINALEIYAAAMAQWEWACREIERKNKDEFGSGYIQTFKTGATNITTELAVRNDAATTLFKCFKQFGLDPKSEGELKGLVEGGQLDLFDEFMKSKNG